MKNIIFFRHGKAENKLDCKSDLKRKLINKGRIKTRISAEVLKQIDIHTALFVSSPAVRAFETAQIVALIYNYPLEQIRQEPFLYGHFDSKCILRFLKKLDNALDTVLFFGHNPEFNEITSAFVPGFNEVIPKSGIVSISLGIKTWKKADTGIGKLMFFESLAKKRKTEKTIR